MWLYGNLYAHLPSTSLTMTTTSTSKTQTDHYHRSSTTATTTTTTTEDKWGLKTHMSQAIGVFFFLIFYFLLICCFTVTSTTTTTNGHSMKTSTPPAPPAMTLTTTRMWDKWQGQREVMTGGRARDAMVSSPWYIFSVFLCTRYASFGPLVSVFFLVVFF